jgi:hypothetical protein
MTVRDRDEPSEDQPEAALSGLEQLARHLDVQVYPGQAWPISGRRRARRAAWTIALGLAAAAALVALAVHGWAVRPAPSPPAPRAGAAVVRAPATSGLQDHDAPALPAILIVEDLDSYSIIDLTAGEPLVTFARKDWCGPLYVVPLLAEDLPPATAPAGKT